MGVILTMTFDLKKLNNVYLECWTDQDVNVYFMSLGP